MSGYELNDNEKAKLAFWLTKHNEECKFANPYKQGAIGGRLTYCFTPTSIGVTVGVQCACGAEEHLTDYDSW